MVSSTTQAILLLTTHLNKKGTQTVQPLTSAEWGRFAEWLREQSLTPDKLLYGSTREILKNWQDAKITIDRVEALLDRGSALALVLEKWLRSGLWVLTRADSAYPARLKQKLNRQAPAVLFGCGNRHLLTQGGLAVVGSRNVKEADLTYSRELGVHIANSGYSVISGGAKGVDETAMLGALEAEGTAVGVLANNLLRACTSQKYRSFLKQNSLVLISPFNPEAGFDVGNAMQRNKYIYCLSDAAVVVHSGTKGGTWNGALENLGKKWVPLWVKRTNDTNAGNHGLVQKGAHWLPEVVNEIDCEKLFKESVQESLLDFTTSGVDNVARSFPKKQSRRSETVVKTQEKLHSAQITENAVNENGIRYNSGKSFVEMTIYESFLLKAKQVCGSDPFSAEELVEKLGLQKSQINRWIRRALSEGYLKKLTKPVRYQWINHKQGILPLD